MPLRWVTLLAIASALPACLVFVWLENAHGGMALENGPMENLQVACLLLGAVLLLIGVGNQPTPGSKWFLGAVALAYITVVILEVDTRSSDLRWLITLFNGRIRDAWLAALWLIAAFFLIRHRRGVWLHFRSWLPTLGGRVFVAAGLLWVLASSLDKTLHGTHKLFAEELCEVAGAWLMALAGWLSARRSAATHAVLNTSSCPKLN